MRQFVQRIAVDYHLEPLSREETLRYIRHRLTLAGGDGQIFDDAACAAVHFFSNGIPRLINSLCDYALVFAYADDRRHIDIDVIIDAAMERIQGGLGAFADFASDLPRAELVANILERPA
jgi:type II secretory pathway predicted ATPase ExeA